jgi:hypothetical protein
MRITKSETSDAKNTYHTSDLSLAGVLFLFYTLNAIEKQPDCRKASFLFERDEHLDQLIEGFWRGELKVDPRKYFEALRIIKARLYSNE